jgi:hypothetical protein
MTGRVVYIILLRKPCPAILIRGTHTLITAALDKDVP